METYLCEWHQCKLLFLQVLLKHVSTHLKNYSHTKVWQVPPPTTNRSKMTGVQMSASRCLTMENLIGYNFFHRLTKVIIFVWIGLWNNLKIKKKALWSWESGFKCYVFENTFLKVKMLFFRIIECSSYFLAQNGYFSLEFQIDLKMRILLIPKLLLSCEE